MKECPICRESIQDGAIKCRYCQSAFSEAPPKQKDGEPGRVTYILDRGVVRYLKVAAGVLALIIGVAAVVLGLDLWKGLRDFHECLATIRAQSANAEGELKKAQDAAKEVLEVKKTIVSLLDEVGRKMADMGRGHDARIREVLRTRSFGVSEERVRTIVQQILVESLYSLSGPGDPAELEAAVGQAVEASARPEGIKKAEERIREDVHYAVQFLNQRFGMQRKPNPLELLPSSERNAYCDKDGRYYCPPEVQHLPDLTYAKIALTFVAEKAALNYNGQPGALLTSYGDILAILIKQARNANVPEEEKWLLSPGAVAWFTGQDIPTTVPRLGIRSLKAPGTAYQNHPLLGSDPQPDHFSDLYTGDQDDGGVHINSGIPSRAFYLTASAVGAEKAWAIWYKALQAMRPKDTFTDAALATTAASVELYGANSAERKAVVDAWQAVGVGARPATSAR